MSWLDIETSLYRCHSDNTGRPASFREILLTAFAVPHELGYTDKETDKWMPMGVSNDLETIIELKALNPVETDYDTRKSTLKKSLQAYTPAALLETKKKGMVKEKRRTGIMQIDFDYGSISDYDVEELKSCVFSLPFIGFCGLSCTGRGFYALALIAEPERLADYAEHCFVVLERYGIIADTSKGPKPENLRYVSYDSNMLIREQPEPLRIANFHKRARIIKNASVPNTRTSYPEANGLVRGSLTKIKNVQRGSRWQIVQQVAYTLGGTGDEFLLQTIKDEISCNVEFSGQEEKYFRCAEDCFAAGASKPLIIGNQNH